jgi:allantoinase
MIAERNEPACTWALRGRAVCTPEGIGPAAILIRGEKIAAVVEPDAVRPSMSVIDVGDHLILPGLVETHAHINEPGRTEWEGFATATRAAAAGGITTLIDMPLNSHPVTTTVSALRLKQQAAAGKIWIDCGFHAGIVPGNAAEVRPLLAAGVCAAKAFLCHSGIDEFPNAAESDLRAVMPMLATAGVPLFAHAELVAPLPEGVQEAFAANPRSYPAYLATRPCAWEVAAIRLLLNLCREYHCPVHIVHLAAAEAIRPLLRDAKIAGLPITVETCPHYLYFASESIPDDDTRFKCAPPIRELRQRECLREMLAAGEIDTIGSDHSPAPPELKRLTSGDLSQAWGGIASLQLLLPIVWTILEGDIASRAGRVASVLAESPARLAGLADRKGAIAPGLDADFVIFDPVAEWIVDAEGLHHHHKATPYEGRKLSGRVQSTILRGRRIYDEGRFHGQPGGCLLERRSDRTRA